MCNVPNTVAVISEACNGTGIKLKGDKGLIWMTAKLYKNDIHCQWHINVDVEKVSTTHVLPAVPVNQIAVARYVH